MNGWEAQIETWLSAEYVVADRSVETIKMRRYQLRRFAGAMSPAGPWDVTGEQVLEWVAGQEWKREARRSWWAALRGFYRWGRRTGRIQSDPTAVLPKLKPEQPRPRRAPEEAVCEARRRARDAEVVMMVRLASEYGLRRGEIARVHVADLERDLLGWSLIVHGKGGKVRRLPLEPGFAATLRAYVAEGRLTGWVFPGAVDGHRSPKSVGNLVTRALPEAWSTHSLRHRFAQRVFEAGGYDLVLAQEALGHASIVTTRIYLEPDQHRLRAAVAAAGR